MSVAARDRAFCPFWCCLSAVGSACRLDLVVSSCKSRMKTLETAAPAAGRSPSTLLQRFWSYADGSVRYPISLPEELGLVQYSAVPLRISRARVVCEWAFQGIPIRPHASLTKHPATLSQGHRSRLPNRFRLPLPRAPWYI